MHFEEKLSFPNKALICPGKWHRLAIRLNIHSSIIQLDDNTIDLKNLRLTSAIVDELRALPVHIGGTTGN